ncbi:hypothetical protein [Micromonospora sp. NPDC006431]|uniref:hypothetical protein n=1 Tax=Micromonospora sp. NPDC006431 TaxID=3364235 RepID=UPI0036CE020C
MSTARVGWAAHAHRLVGAAADDRAWYQAVARELVSPGDRLAGDGGCGGAGMTLALARHMRCGHILAVDAEPAILHAARERMRNEWADPRIRIDVLRTGISGTADVVRDAIEGQEPRAAPCRTGGVRHCDGPAWTRPRPRARMASAVVPGPPPTSSTRCGGRPSSASAASSPAVPSSFRPGW